MSKIDEMIARHCANGVEFSKLGEIAEIGTGSSNRQELVTMANFHSIGLPAEITACRQQY